jgi:hypothetical protein
MNDANACVQSLPILRMRSSTDSTPSCSLSWYLLTHPFKNLKTLPSLQKHPASPASKTMNEMACVKAKMCDCGDGKP